MDAKEETKKVLLTEPQKILIQVSVPAIASFALSFVPRFQSWVVQRLSSASLLLIASFAFTAFVSSLGYAFYLRHKLRELSIKPVFAFGVLWDNNQNALCQVCETHLSFSTSGGGYVGQHIEPFLSCPKCNRGIDLIDEQGQIITLSQAKKALHKS